MWIVFEVFHALLVIKSERSYCWFALHSSSEQIRAFNSIYPDGVSKDFYAILKRCDQILPTDEKLQIILPESPQSKHTFLMAKSRYILYPRNYGNNTIPQNYILVYQRNDFSIPQNYRILKSFGSDRYLLVKKDLVPFRN